jgi:hypothetical protein
LLGKDIDQITLLAHLGYRGGRVEAPVHTASRCTAYSTRTCSKELEIFENAEQFSPKEENRKKIKGFRCW